MYIFFILLMLTRLVEKITIRIIYYNNLLAIFQEPTLEVEIQTNNIMIMNHRAKTNGSL